MFKNTMKEMNKSICLHIKIFSVFFTMYWSIFCNPSVNACKCYTHIHNHFSLVCHSIEMQIELDLFLKMERSKVISLTSSTGSDKQF